jgi:predicted transposase YdaD
MIMVYGFEQFSVSIVKCDRLSRAEVESMLGITLKETRVYREIKEEGRVEGRVEGREVMANAISRQLTKRFGGMSEEMRLQISGLPLPVLEDLSEALLDFTQLADLQAWLEAR